MAARKTERGWFVRSEELPLTEAQREQVQRRSENVRSAVDAALPSRAVSPSTLHEALHVSADSA